MTNGQNITHMWIDEVMDDGVTLRSPNPEYFKQLSEKTMEDMVAGRDPAPKRDYWAPRWYIEDWVGGG